MPGDRLDPVSMALRAAQEIRPGDSVAIGSGLPASIPAALPAGSGVWFLSESGAVGYRPAAPGDLVEGSGGPAVSIPGGAIVGTIDVSAMLASGNVPLAFVEAAQVSALGDFVHWTTAETGSLAAPGFAVDLASGARRVVALMTHATDTGTSRIHDRCSLPVDGPRSLSLIITDISVLRVADSGLELIEVAPGWSSDDVAAMTEAPFAVSPSPPRNDLRRPRIGLAQQGLGQRRRSHRRRPGGCRRQR